MDRRHVADLQSSSSIVVSRLGVYPKSEEYIGSTLRTLTLIPRILTYYTNKSTRHNFNYIQDGFYILNRQTLTKIKACLNAVTFMKPYSTNLFSEDIVMGICCHAFGIKPQNTLLVNPWALKSPECSQKISIHLVKRNYKKHYKFCQ